MNNVYNDEDVIDVYNDDDVCNFMMEYVGSSSNSPDANKHDKIKISVEREVYEEPGGNVSMRSCSLRFRHLRA